MAEARRIGLDEVVRHFEGLEDPRSSVNRKHPLVSVVVIAIMAVLAGVGGPTASWLASKRPAATSSSSAIATSSACWPRAGWACRRRTRVASCSAPRRFPSSDTSTPWMSRLSCCGMTTDTPSAKGSALAPLTAPGHDRRF